MKKITLVVSMITLCVGFSSSALAQVSDAALTSASIVTPISIVKDVDMNFGDIAVQGGAVAAIVMDSTGTRSVESGITYPGTALNTAAQFTVQGQANYTYGITLPGTIALTGTTVGSTVSNFTSNSTGTLTGGTEIVSVGGTLNLVANQAAGTYTNANELVVTVNYN
jgi:hypothetical protein